MELAIHQDFGCGNPLVAAWTVRRSEEVSDLRGNFKTFIWMQFPGGPLPVEPEEAAKSVVAVADSY